jgi:CHASE1-domain containing sensor protein
LAVDNAIAKSELKLEEELKKINLVVNSMGFFFENSPEVSQPLFERFTNPFLGELRGIMALEWAPRVSVSEVSEFEDFWLLPRPTLPIAWCDPKPEIFIIPFAC